MFNPDEVAKAAAEIASHPEPLSATALNRFQLAKIELAGCDTSEVIFEERPNQLSAEMRVPEFILGTPLDANCLDGIAMQRFRQPAHIVRLMKDVSVVGWRTLLTSDRRVYAGRAINSSESFEDFSRGARSGFEGVIPIDGPDGTKAVAFPKPRREIRIAGTGLFLGMLEQGNYGSFIFRGLPQILLAGELSLSVDFLVVGSRTAWLDSVLQYLGFGHLPLLTVREIYGSRFDQLIVIDEMDGEGFIDDLSLLRLRKFSRMCAAQATISLPKKLYVSRGLSANRSPHYRVLMNEEEVENLAQRSGYHVIFPETYGFFDQVTIFHRAEKIMGPSGSGMLNAAFAAEKCRVTDFEVFHNTVRQHAKIYSSTGKQYGFLFGESLYADRQHWMLAPWTIGTHLVEQAIDLMQQ